MATRGIRRTARAGAVAAVVVTALAALAGPAQAKSVFQSCEAGGDKLSTTVYYYNANKTTWTLDYNSATITNNSANKNNLYMRLRNNGGNNEYWAWTSDDNIKGGQTYSISTSAYVPKSGSPYMKTNAIFDQSGSDPNCSTYAYLV